MALAHRAAERWLWCCPGRICYDSTLSGSGKSSSREASLWSHPAAQLPRGCPWGKRLAEGATAGRSALQESCPREAALQKLGPRKAARPAEDGPPRGCPSCNDQMLETQPTLWEPGPEGVTCAEEAWSLVQEKLHNCLQKPASGASRTRKEGCSS